MRNRIGLCIFLLLNGAGGAVKAQTPPANLGAAPTEKVAPWRFIYHVGARQRLRTHAVLSSTDPANPVVVQIVTTSASVVKSVASNGDAVLSTRGDAEDIKINGQAVPSPPELPAVTRTVTAAGLLKQAPAGAGTGNGGALTRVIELLQNTPAPQQPVAVGESWAARVANPFLPGRSVDYACIFVGRRSLLGFNTVAVRIRASVPMTDGATPGLTIHLDSLYYVDPVAGRIVGMQFSADHVPVAAAGLADGVLHGHAEMIVAGTNDTTDVLNDGELATSSQAPTKPAHK
ncbi:MAG: hypothetical protein KGJ62_02460 [Armatimonadetes bacterium]|nr:hypothetical protein [Armatimonadota bacterium]MDE2205316.1 hypothetical protein [Armatimonadota bacterium]